MTFRLKSFWQSKVIGRPRLNVLSGSLELYKGSKSIRSSYATAFCAEPRWEKMLVKSKLFLVTVNSGKGSYVEHLCGSQHLETQSSSSVYAGKRGSLQFVLFVKDYCISWFPLALFEGTAPAESPLLSSNRKYWRYKLILFTGGYIMLLH